MMPYLTRRGSFREPEFVLVLISFYLNFGAAGPYAKHVSLLLGLCLAALIVRAPRWVPYLLVAVCLALTFSNEIFVDAVGSQDAASDRDDAVELACKALIKGKNPWATATQLGGPISTGPASILAALPFVYIFGRINELTFCFWAAIGVLAAVGDIQRQNRTFLPLAILLQLGFFDLRTTRYWSLDELSYAVLLFPLAWYAVEKKRFVVAGAALGCTLGCRASYIFPVVGFLCWMAWEQRCTWRSLVKTGAAGAGTFAALVAAFAIGFHSTIRAANPLSITFSKAAWVVAGTNDVTTGMAVLFQKLPPNLLAPGRTICALLLTALSARLLRALMLNNAMLYVALGSLYAFTVVHYAGRFADNFTAPIALCGLLAVAFSIEKLGQTVHKR